MKTVRTFEVMGHHGQLTLEAVYFGGTWAVTRDLYTRSYNLYCLTHIKIGARLPGLFPYKKAIKIAKQLDMQPQWKFVKRPPKSKKAKLKYRALFDDAVETAKSA